MPEFVQSVLGRIVNSPAKIKKIVSLLKAWQHESLLIIINSPAKINKKNLRNLFHLTILLLLKLDNIKVYW